MAVPAALLWTDLANHLIRLWRHLRIALGTMNLFAYLPEQLLLAVKDALDSKEE